MKKCIAVLLMVILLLQLLITAVFAYSSADFPSYTGKAYVEINGDIPTFTASECSTTTSFELYDPLDDLGRCTCAYACVGQDLMPTGERGSISSVKPTGWQTATYDIVSGKYLYNRCHLIGWQLTGENANWNNLITGTRYLNIDGMLSFEDEVAEYVKETDNHVLYRVTPVFDGNELVARGVVMEGYSVEDKGQGICFYVYCYNVQPGITIDYSTGLSRLASAAPEPKTYSVSVSMTFVLNTNTKKYHLPTCSSAVSMSEKNKDTFTGDHIVLEGMGYAACSKCHPDQAAATVTYYYGDADLDGKITSADARLVLRCAVGLDQVSGVPQILSDADGDGKITSADARIVLRAAVGLEVIS